MPSVVILLHVVIYGYLSLLRISLHVVHFDTPGVKVACFTKVQEK